jgi:hypothetical protein
MLCQRRNIVLMSLAALVSLRGSLPACGGDAPLRYARDVRPILAEKCLHCHGPDEVARQADLRLDIEEQSKAERDGMRAIVPGNPDESALWRRITSRDEGERMPPPDQPRQLAASEITVLRRWIEQGAPYEPHWSFTPPVRPAVPSAGDSVWPRNALDRFVLDRLDREVLPPAADALPAMLLRRVTLDLTGLPPTPDEVDAFLADGAPGAYERVVDRLLASPHYGERMALMWLDLARYADSGGYQGDILRTMWPWRDWAIEAFNRNQPFDEFTIEQIAGDLLPEPTLSQRIATGFHRNHRINDEDGIVHEEFRVEYVADRTETTGSVWMGLTLGCARCHDHKYDPFSQRDYYRLFAFFNSVDESGRGHGNAPPIVRLFTPAQQQQLDDIERQLAELQAAASPTGVADKADDAAARTQQIEVLNKQKAALIAAVTTTMVLQELPAPRPTHVLFRGAYDQPRDPVSPGVPPGFPPLPADAASNRLALARWLLDPQHPLTARVFVNHVWQMLFGAGLVRTPEDFGTRGEPPTHPELLDWLAAELVQGDTAMSVGVPSADGGTGPAAAGAASGSADGTRSVPATLAWDVKRLVRLIVTSATYRQSSGVTEDEFRCDPENRLLARGPRFRLPAETIRDQALAASGLLSRRIGGPSVRPYQPDGLWKDLASAHLDYQQGHGEDLYRRSLYTFLRRTVSPPAMAALDAPNREICTVRRARTNTPVQALVLMNDPTFVEAARVLAQRVLVETHGDPATQVRAVFRRVLAREPDRRELETLQTVLDAAATGYRADPDRAGRLLNVGEFLCDPALDPCDVAALAGVVAVVFNLDETLKRE